ncbi:MAP kinase kinase (MEK) [Irineochytrium annulatum]|nr:MAP kinase kinase (MEK) [Irineochytrium annulatum]
MESLPYDLLAVILRHLDPANDLRQLLSVSKSFRRNLAFITSDVGFALSHLAVASTTFDLSSFFLSLPAAAAVSVQQQSRIPRGLRWDRVPPNYHAAWIVKLGGMSLRAACVITGWSATRELITSSTACFPSPSACKSLASAFERAVTEFAGAMDAHADGDFGLAWCVLLGDSATASNVVGVYLAMGAETSAEALGVALVNAARAGHDGAAEKLVRSGRVPLAKGSTTMGKVAKAAMDGGHEKFMRMLLKVAKEVKEDGGGDVDVSPVQSAILKSAKKAASKALSTLDARTNKTLSMVVTTKSTMVRDDEPSSEANPMKDVKRRATTMAVNEIAHFGKQPLASGAMTTESPSSAAMPYLPADEKLKAKHFEFLSDFGGRPPDTVHHVLHRPSGLIMARKSVWVSADNEHEARSTAKALRKEVKVLQDLGESKNVGKFYGSYLDADRNACLCYEFMDLGSLREISRGTGAVPERFLLRIAVQALSGVAYLIDKGMNVAHIGKYGMQTYAFVELIRYFADIRPSSFHANSRGQIKLVEFIVLDNFQRNLCRNNVNDDSPYYLPPERITASSISISSASWPMGMIFAELATGRFPYPSDLSLFEVMSRIADEEPLEMPRGAGFSDGFVDLVGCW